MVVSPSKLCLPYPPKVTLLSAKTCCRLKGFIFHTTLALKVFGALNVSRDASDVELQIALIYAGPDLILATSLLETSNHFVLRESSLIHSNAHLGVHGQGYLNLAGPEDMIEAQHLGYVKISKLYYELEDCLAELIHPPEDCNNANSSVPFIFRLGTWCCRLRLFQNDTKQLKGVIEPDMENKLLLLEESR